MKTDVVVHFDSEEKAKHFLDWLGESGEQSYLYWMEGTDPSEKHTVRFECEPKTFEVFTR